MACTLKFSINNIDYEIKDLPLDNYIKEGTLKIDNIEDLMILVNNLEPDALEKFSNDLEKQLKIKAEVPYEYTSAVSVGDLMNNTLFPNQLNIDIINSLREEGTPVSKLSYFIIKSLLEDGRDISFLSQPIRTPRGGTAQGFFDKESGNIFIHVGKNESIKSSDKIEILAHELIHKYLSDGIYTDPGIQELLLKGYALVKEKWGNVFNLTGSFYPSMSSIIKVIDGNTGNGKLEEILAYALTNTDFQRFMEDAKIGQEIPLLRALTLGVQNFTGNLEELNSIFKRFSTDEIIEPEINYEEWVTNNLRNGEAFEADEKGKVNGKHPAVTRWYTLRHRDNLKEKINVQVVEITNNRVQIEYELENGETDRIYLVKDQILTNDYLPFGDESTSALIKAAIDPQKYDRQGYIDLSTSVRNRFINNTKTLPEEGGYDKFDTNYSKTHEISEKNRDLQLLGLRQDDLVLLPMSLQYDRSSDKWVKVEPSEKKFEGSSFRPIMGTFMQKGKMMIRVPSADGKSNYDISGEYVTGFRRYAGDLREEAPDLESITIAYNKLMENYPDSEVEGDKESVLKVITSKFKDEHGELIGYEKFIPSNKNSMGFAFTNGASAQSLFDGLVENDIVKVLFKSKTKKYKPFRGIVTRKLGNSVEIVSTAGVVHYVNVNNLVEIIYMDENHKEFKKLIEDENGTIDVKSYFYTETKKLSTLPSGEVIETDETETKINDAFRVEYLDQYDKDTKGYKTKDYYSFGPKPITSTKETKEAYKEIINRRKNLISKLRIGDLVKVSWNITESTDGNKNSHMVSGWYPVIATTANTVYFYNKKGNIMHINITKSFGDSASLAGVAYNNIEDAKLFDDFNAKKRKYQQIFDEKALRQERRIAALKANESTELQEEYYITEYDEYDPENAGELKQDVSKLTRGDIIRGIVFTEENGENREKWHVVTDIDDEGRPLCVTYTKSYLKKFVSGKEFTTKAGYKVYPIELDKITAIGLNAKPNLAIGVIGNQSMLEKIKNYKAKFTAFRKPKFITAEQTKSEKFAQMRRVKEAIYGVKNGKPTWAVSEKFLDSTIYNPNNTKDKGKLPKKVVPMYYVLEKNGSFYTEGQAFYDDLWYPYEIKGSKVHDSLNPGDIVTETWQYQGKPVYMQGVIKKKNKNSLKILCFDYKSDSDELTFSDRTILRKFPKKGEAPIVEYPGINSISFEKKGRGKDGTKLLIKELRDLRGNSPKAEEGKARVVKDAPKPEVKKSKKYVSKFSKDTTAFTKSVDSADKIETLVDLLKSAYDVDIIMMRAEEIAENFDSKDGKSKWTPSGQRAFIYEGKIYINLDMASSAEPLHEMGHLVLSAIKTRNMPLYEEMLSVVESHPDYDNIAKDYPERIGDDLKEEVFVTIFGEHYRDTLAKNNYTKEWNEGNKSLFQRVTEYVKQLFAVIFNSPHLLDYDEKEFIGLSLDQMMNRFGDNLMEGKFNHVLSQYTNVVERKINNLQSKLIEDGILRAECFK